MALGERDYLVRFQHCGYHPLFNLCCCCCGGGDVSFSFRVLVGAEQSFVYDVGQEEVNVRAGIRVNHLTPVSRH